MERKTAHSERVNKTRETEEEVGRQHQEMDKPGVRQNPRRQLRTEENGGN